jgi:hypothetical protein
MASYLKAFDPTVQQKDTLLIMPVWLAMQSVGTLVSTRLSAKLGYRMVSICAF